MSRLTLHDPLWLLALLALPVIVWLRGRRKVPVLLVPYAAAWHRPSLVPPARWPVILAFAGLILLIGGLARPQRVEDKREINSEGYDIMLAIDLSTSMRAEDFEKDGERINRLQAIKPVIQAFIEKRPTDRIGIVLFSGRAYTMAPLTFDHDWLARQLSRVKIGMIEDGTAIGDGLGVSLTRLEQAKRDSGGKRMGAFVVLLTDGANNRGALQPQQAADIAKSRGVPVYTIGAGKEGYVPVPVYDDNNRKMGYRRMLSDVDEPALRQIADTTGGKFFRVADTGTVESAFRAIDRAQKIEFQAKSYLLTTELFWWFAVPGAACFLLSALLSMPRALPAGMLTAAPGDLAAGEPPSLPGQIRVHRRTHPAWATAAVVLLAVNVVLAYLDAKKSGFDLAKLIGFCVGQFVLPLIVVGLFAIGQSFRNPRSMTLIVVWTSLVMLLLKFV